MKKTNPQNENLTDILKLLTKRIEEAAVDIHTMKGRMGIMELKLGTVDINTKVIKSDVEKLRGEMKKVEENVEDLIEMNSEIIAKMNTQDELKTLSQRITTLEHQ